MLRDLRRALAHITKARHFVRRDLNRFHYPLIFEDLDYLVANLSAMVKDRTPPQKAHSPKDNDHEN